MLRTEVLLEGLSFPEGPRWRDGRLWFSDFYLHEVVRVDLLGRRETVVAVAGQPSGLGFLPDGRLLVVSMVDRRLLRLDPEGLIEVADLSLLAPAPCNDMVTDSVGRCYVGNFGFDRRAGDPPTTTCLIRVDPEGETTVVADDLFFPNGTIVSADGTTLVVAETRRGCLTAFEIDALGDLSKRRTWADLGNHVPDGICLDQEGAIWVADPRHAVVLRVHEGGRISDVVSTGDRGAYACMLGGEDRRTLFVCTNTASGPETAELRQGRIEIVEVSVPGAGLP